MSITLSYIRVSAAEWESLSQQTEDDFAAYRFSRLNDVRQLYTDGDFAAIHFLLTGQAPDTRRLATGPPSLEWIVMGGTPTRFDYVYTPVRWVSPEQVRICTALLEAVTEEEIMGRLTPEAFNRHQIFPNSAPRFWDEEELEPIPIILEGVRWFWQQARDASEGILINL